ncbi:MAG: type IV pilus assembly protein PilM [Fimbriimonadaceae bacterium]|nr:type IV pilus assembly protein PilM [Fimbriimonadaceae bacterium]
MSLKLFGKKSVLGLDIGHHTINGVLIDRTADGWRVSRFGSVPTPPETVREGVVIDDQAVGAAIRQLMKEHQLNATGANIAVSGASVVVRTVRIPRMPEATLRKSIKYEASRYVPSSVEESHIEFEIVGMADENQMDVMVVAAPRDVVASRIKACAAADLEVEVVDIESFATYRSIVEADPNKTWREDTIALVDIGSSTTSMSVVSHGMFCMTRSIPHGGQTLTEALKSYFKLSDPDAETGKSQLDVSELTVEGQPSENPPLRVLQPHLDDLVREVRRSLNYYQSQQTETGVAAPVTSLVVTGGGAKLHGLAKYIGHKLQLETVSAGVFENPRFVAAGVSDGNGLDLTVATGLAMRAHQKAA